MHHGRHSLESSIFLDCTTSWPFCLVLCSCHVIQSSLYAGNQLFGHRVQLRWESWLYVLSIFNAASTHHHAGASPSTLLLVILGPVILVCAGFYEVHTTREALFPPAAFKSLTVGKKLALRGFLFGSWCEPIVIILTVTFLHNFAFTAGTFYLALYFQVMSSRILILSVELSTWLV